MRRVRIDDEWIDVPDDATPEDLANLADSQDEAPDDPTVDDTAPVVVATAPVPVARGVPVSPAPAAAVQTAPLPPILRNPAQGSNSSWILPDQFGRIGVVSTAPTPPGGVTSAPLPTPAGGASVPYDPLSSVRAPAPSVARPGAVTRGPDLPAPTAGQRTIKVNGQPMPVPANWDQMDDDAKGDYIDAALAPSPLPDALTRLQPFQPGPVSEAPRFTDPVSPLLPPVPQPGKDAWIPPDQLQPRQPRIPEVAALTPEMKAGDEAVAALPQDPLIQSLTDEIARAKQIGGNEALIRTAETALANAKARQAALEERTRASASTGPSAVTRGFVSGLLKQNPGLTAEALEAAAVASDSPTLQAAADALRNMNLNPKGYDLKAKLGILDSLKGGDFDAAMTTLGETFGSGAASTVPTLAGGAVGGFLGGRIAGKPGAAVGAAGGAFAPSYALAVGDLYQQLKQEGVPKKGAAKAALQFGVPIAAIDSALGPVAKVARSLGGVEVVKKQIIQGVAKRLMIAAAKGASEEGLTEAVQQAISEGVAAVKTGNWNTWKRANNIVEAAIGGAVVGGPLGAAHPFLPGEHGPNVDVQPGEQPQPATPPQPVPTQQEPGLAVSATQPPATEPVQGPASAAAMPAQGPAPSPAGDIGRPPAPAGAGFAYPEGTQLTPGMRNNNPGNIKYRQGQPFNTTPSTNLDQGDPQAVYATPEDGMKGMVELIQRKFGEGRKTINQLIADQGGWTPGNRQAAANIAATAGVDPNEEIDLSNPEVLHRVMRGIITQEHGRAGDAFTDELIDGAIQGTPADASTGQPSAPARAGEVPAVTPRTGPLIPNSATRENMGDPDAPNFAADNITEVKVGDQRWQINKRAAPDVQGFLEELRSRGVPITASGGYNNRNIRGSKTKKSQHAWGTAFDINAKSMPLGKATEFFQQHGLSNEQVRELAAKHNLFWGGDFKGRPDPMHFEWNPGGAAAPTAAPTVAGASSTPSPAVTTVPAEVGGAASTTTSAGSVPGAPASAAEPAFTWAHSEPQTSASIPQFNQLETDAGKIVTRPMVVDMADIVHSGQEGYDQQLQPRDRDRAASQQQVQGIASRFDPRVVTAITGDASTGPPVVNHRGMVESGNGRAMALEQVYAKGGGEAYRQQLQSMGFNTDGMERPILVQQRVTPLQGGQLQGFVQGANASRSLRMSTAEQARADARRISPEMLQSLAQEGPGRNPANNPVFRRAFMQGVPETERAALQDKSGKLTAEGTRRVQNGVLSAAYGESPAIERVLETTDDNTKALSQSMIEAAPEMAQLRAGIQNGTIDPSVEPWLNAIPQAVQRISEARAAGMNALTQLDQQDAFNPVPEEEEKWVRDFLKPDGKPRAKKDVDAALRFYAEESLKATQTGGLDLGTAPVTPRQVQARAGEIARGGRNQAENTGAGSAGGADQRQLFGSNERGSNSGVPEQPAAGPQDRGQIPGEVGGGQADQAGEGGRAGGAAPDQTGKVVSLPKKAKKAAKKARKAAEAAAAAEQPSDIASEPARSVGAAAPGSAIAATVGPAGGRERQMREAVRKGLGEQAKEWAADAKNNFKALVPDGQSLKGTNSAWNRVRRFGAVVAYSAGGRLRAYYKIWKSPALKEISDMFQTTAGDFEEKAGGGSALRSQSFDLAVKARFAEDTNEVVNILRPLGLKGPRFEADMVKLGAALRTDQRPEESHLAQAYDDIRNFFERKHLEMRDAGVNVGYVGDPLQYEATEANRYYRRRFNPAAIQAEGDRFVKLATQEYIATGMNAAEAEDSARALQSAIVFGDMATMQDFGNFGSGVASTKIMQARKFKKSADANLADFYFNDPADIMLSYSREANLKMEQVRRLGPNGEKWKELMNQARLDGVPEDIRGAIARTVSTIIGQNSDRYMTSRKANEWLDMGRTASTLGMLDKAVFASLTESIMPAIRRGGLNAPVHMVNSLARTVYEFGRDLRQDLPGGAGRTIKLSEAREFAETLGLLMDSANVNLSAMRLTHDIPGGATSEKIKGRFFRMNLLTQLTNAQKVAGVQQARGFIRDHAKGVLKGSALSRDYLTEARIPKAQQHDFAEFVLRHSDGLPTRFELTGEMGQYYENALHVFLSQAIMEPTAADKPRWMSTAFGSIIGQFAGFSWASGRNVLARYGRLGARAFDPRADWSAMDRARALAVPLYGVAGMYLAGSLVRLLRDAIFPNEAENRRKLTAKQQQVQILAQSGLLGPFESILTPIFGTSPTRGGGAITVPMQNLIMDPLAKTFDWYWTDQSSNSLNRKRWNSYINIANPVWNGTAALFAPAWMRPLINFPPEVLRGALIDELAGEQTNKSRAAERRARAQREKNEWPIWSEMDPLSAVGMPAIAPPP